MGKSAMDCSVEEIQTGLWRVSIASITRLVRFRSDSKSFAPWDVMSADGRTLWSGSSLESALRWIQVHTGYPAEALFAQSLLEGSTGAPSVPADAPQETTATSKSRQALGH
jgi:hypothetical protein